MMNMRSCLHGFEIQNMKEKNHDIFFTASNPRLRAAVFVNLVGMRKSMSCPTNGPISLTPENLSKLQRCNFLFHAAHNRNVARC